MRPLSALAVMALRQALPVRRTIVLVLIQFIPMIVYLLSTQNRTELAALEAFVGIGSAMLLALAVPVVAIVIGAGALGAERRDETLSFVVLRPMPRSALAAVKTATAILAASAISLIGALALGIAHVAQFGDASLIAGMAYAVLIATALYVSVMVPLGFLTDRAVLIAMVYLFVFENGVVTALPALASASPWHIGLAGFGAIVDDTTSIVDELTGSLTLSAVTPLITVAGIFAISVLVTALMLRQRDLA